MEVSRGVELGFGIGSAVLLVGTAVAIPLVLRSLPADYFIRPLPPRRGVAGVLKTVLGVTLVVLGVAMLVLPGQGLLTIAIGLSVLELHSQRKAVTWILRRPHVDAGVQRLRKRAGRPPLILPHG